MVEIRLSAPETKSIIINAGNEHQKNPKIGEQKPERRRWDNRKVKQCGQ